MHRPSEVKATLDSAVEAANSSCGKDEFRVCLWREYWVAKKSE